MKLSILSLLGVWDFLILATAQLSGHLETTTTRDAKGARKSVKLSTMEELPAKPQILGHRSCQLLQLARAVEQVQPIGWKLER